MHAVEFNIKTKIAQSQQYIAGEAISAFCRISTCLLEKGSRSLFYNCSDLFSQTQLHKLKKIN